MFSLVPIKRSSSLSPSFHRGRSLPPPSSNGNRDNLAVIGPNEKFSKSHLYQLRQPIKDQHRIAKSQEYAILGRNEKFQDNTIYPLRRSILDDSSTTVRTRYMFNKIVSFFLNM